MRKITKVIKAQLLDFSELSFEDQKLLEAARLQRMKAQAPYSHYWCGAAAVSITGQVYVGCNIERASYSETTHAEEAAVNAVINAEGSTKIVKVATVGGPEGKVISFSDKEDPPGICTIAQICVACGHCLQIIWENCWEDRNVVLLGRTAWGEIAITTIGDAYPMPFGPEDLGVDYKVLKAIS